jgi:hypothetical protein
MWNLNVSAIKVKTQSLIKAYALGKHDESYQTATLV